MSSAKGQIALTMLTRFSMVFFIIMLAVIMIGFTDTEKKGVCNTRANAVASGIASAINGVLNSPSEDERKVIPFTVTLSSGSRDFERYWIELTNRPSQQKQKTGSIMVEVKTNAKVDCNGGARASYDSTLVVDKRQLQPEKPFYLFPSNVSVRDYYLVLVKCRPKKPGYSSYLFIDRCRAPLGQEADPKNCLPFKDTRVHACCGWGGEPKCE